MDKSRKLCILRNAVRQYRIDIVTAMEECPRVAHVLTGFLEEVEEVEEWLAQKGIMEENQLGYALDSLSEYVVKHGLLNGNTPSSVYVASTGKIGILRSLAPGTVMCRNSKDAAEYILNFLESQESTEPGDPGQDV